MAKHGRKKRRYRRRKREIEVPADEVFDAGPFEMARFGRLVRFRSKLSAEQLAAMHAEMAKDIGPARADVDARIRRLLDILSEFDPLDIIATVSFSRCFRSLDSDESPRDADPITDVEHLVSLATARPYPVSPIPPSSAVIQEVLDSLEGLRHAVGRFYMLRDAARASELEGTDELAFLRRAETLYVRGDEYEVVSGELLQELFAPCGDFFAEHFGFRPEDVVAFYYEAESQVESAAWSFLDDLRKTWQPLIDAYQSYVSSGGRTLPEPSKIDPLPNPTKHLIEIVPKTDVHQRVCRRLSHEIGENRAFLTGLPEWSGWPLNPSLVHTRPVTSHQGRWYLPCPPTAFYSLHSALDDLIETTDPTWYEDRFRIIRAEYLVRKSRELLASWFGATRIFQSAYYVDPSTGNRCEADLVVVAGTVLVLVECKSGSLAPSARRGGASRLKANLEGLIANAQQQSQRTLQAVRELPKTRFVDATGRLLFDVHRDGIEQVFMVSVTLEHLGAIAADTALLRAAQVLDSGVLSWVVSLADLMVIHHVLYRPSVFLHFLSRRIQFASSERFRTHDELDLVMCYLRQGLWFEDLKLGGNLNIDNWTDELDRYYLWRYLSGRPDKPQIKPVERPDHALAEKLDPILTALERAADGAGLSCAIALLEFHEDSLRGMLKKVSELERMVVGDGRRHTLTVYVKNKYAILLGAHMAPISETEARRLATICFRRGARKVYTITWRTPLTTAVPNCWVFEPPRAYPDTTGISIPGHLQ